MEHLSEELKRQVEQAAKPQNIEPSPPPSDSPQTIDEPHCARCQDYGFVRSPHSPDEPGFAKALPCPDCNLDATYTFGNFRVIRGTRKALDLAKEFAAGKTDKPCLLLVGTFGSGKSHLARAIKYEMQKRLQPVAFFNVPRMLEGLRTSYADEHHAAVLASFCPRTLAIYDDLGDVGNITPWVKEQIYMVLNLRYEKGSPTIITTNNSLEEIGQLYGGRVASRLFDTERTNQAILTCPDYRTGKAW